MADSMLANITAPYTRAEAWAYDRFIAPAVASFRAGRAQQLLDRVPRGGRLLDVGCGGGHNLAELARERPDLHLTGLDLAEGQIQRARRRTASAADRVELVQGSALQLPFEEASYDAVMSVGSIKHWPDQALGVSECVRVLKPGGALIVVEADRGCSFDDAMDFVSSWRLPRALRHLGVSFFMTYVAGRSLDIGEARGLIGSLPLSEHSVERIEGVPALMMLGTRA